MSRNRLLDAPTTVTPGARLALGRGCRGRGRLNGPDARLLGQRERQHLVNPLDRLDLEVALDVVGNLDEILLVLIRNQDRLDPTPMSRQQLLFQAADRQNLTT